MGCLGNLFVSLNDLLYFQETVSLAIPVPVCPLGMEGSVDLELQVRVALDQGTILSN